MEKKEKRGRGWEETEGKRDLGRKRLGTREGEFEERASRKRGTLGDHRKEAVALARDVLDEGEVADVVEGLGRAPEADVH